jgi:GT2 family glycosyltransferase
VKSTSKLVPSLSIVIPTYRRARVLLDTIEFLSQQASAEDEILVVDQTEEHDTDTAVRLQDLHELEVIRWLRQPKASVTAAMNRGLVEAAREIVVFTDDDIRPEPGFVSAHRDAHRATSRTLIAGRVIQPWEEGTSLSHTQASRFSGVTPTWISEFMGGNFSIRQKLALELGGFDENFVHVAYRFEAEFAHRFRAAGGRIYFEPRACLHHLRVASGGTRSYGEHLKTARPSHAVGDYYFALRTSKGGSRIGRFLGRPVRAIATRHHLRRPWWIPVTLCAEVRGMWWALRLQHRGPQLIGTTRHVS